MRNMQNVYGFNDVKLQDSVILLWKRRAGTVIVGCAKSITQLRVDMRHNRMGGSLLLARLFRKKPRIADPGTDGSPQTIASKGEIIVNTVRKIGNPSFVTSYFVVLCHSAILAPSSLPAVVFVASIAALLSELCKYEFLTCKRNTSSCPYICTYQILGELPAFAYGWLQLLGKAAMIAILARGLGSVFVQIVGHQLVDHHVLFPIIANEESIGVVSILAVSCLIFCGLHMIESFSIATKAVSVFAIVLFAAVLSWYPTGGAGKDGRHVDSPRAIEDDFLLSATILTMAFKPDTSKEPKLLSKSSALSIFIGANYCASLPFLVFVAIIMNSSPVGALTTVENGWQMLDILVNLIQGTHWFVISFACCSIVILAMTLLEGIEDGRRHIYKMSTDGLLFQWLAEHSKWPLLAMLIVSVILLLLMPTFTLVGVTSLTHLAVEALFAITVTYRRYCTGPLVPTRRTPKTVQNGHRRLDNAAAPETAESSGSDETDVDVAVDEYKTHAVVATVMEWSRSEVFNDRNWFKRKITGKYYLNLKALWIVAVVAMVAIASVMRGASSWDAVWLSLCMLSFAVYFVVLFVMWTHPQKLRPESAVFKVPCVPWIPMGSALFDFVFAFQLSFAAWATSLLWLVSGFVLYAAYGYRHSRLNLRRYQHGTNSERGNARVSSSYLHIRPDALFSLSDSSVAVYPQPYNNLM